MGVTAKSLLGVAGIARSTYHYQPDAMKRPDKDASLLVVKNFWFDGDDVNVHCLAAMFP